MISLSWGWWELYRSGGLFASRILVMTRSDGLSGVGVLMGRTAAGKQFLVLQIGSDQEIADEDGGDCMNCIIELKSREVDEEHERYAAPEKE